MNVAPTCCTKGVKNVLCCARINSLKRAHAELIAATIFRSADRATTRPSTCETFLPLIRTPNRSQTQLGWPFFGSRSLHCLRVSYSQQGKHKANPRIDHSNVDGHVSEKASYEIHCRPK